MSRKENQIWLKDGRIKTYRQGQFSLVIKLIIFGSPASSKNSRQGHFLSAQARKYQALFSKQIKRIKRTKKLSIPYDSRELYWAFEIYFNRRSADASIELIFDLMQENGIITNDNTIRRYCVDATDIDSEIPRCIISIYKQQQGKA